MRTMLLAASASLLMFAGAASAAPVTTEASSPMVVDYYAFAGGRDAVVAAPLQVGRSAAEATMRPYTAGDIEHVFAPWGFAD